MLVFTVDCGNCSCEAFRDFFSQSYDVWADIAGKDASVSPLLCSLGEIPLKLPESVFVSSESSIASVVRTMVDARSSRVFIRRETSEGRNGGSGAVVGVVRASDIFLLLLKEKNAAETTSGSKGMGNWKL